MFVSEGLLLGNSNIATISWKGAPDLKYTRTVFGVRVRVGVIVAGGGGGGGVGVGLSRKEWEK